jgi:pilus assembly protein CpaE
MGNLTPIFVLENNHNSLEIIKEYMSEIFPNYDVQYFLNYEQALDKIKEVKPVVILGMTEDFEEYEQIIQDIRLYTPKIVITSTDFSTNTIVKAMRFGAKTFLPKPVLKEDLKRVVTNLLNEKTLNNPRVSNIITIYSNKGGIGKTTIATNLAVELAKTTHDKVALLDFNLQIGDITTFLNIDPSFDIGYVIKNLINKKPEVLFNAFEKYKDTELYILSDPFYVEESECITPLQIERLLESLKLIFPYIIIDMSSNIDSNSLKILDKSDFVLFTSIVNLPAIRNAQRCIKLFESRHYPKDKIKIIINRYMENDEIKICDIEHTLGEHVYWRIPNNYFSIMEAINRGITVNEVNSNSNIANSFKDLAAKLSDDIVKQTIMENKI